MHSPYNSHDSVPISKFVYSKDKSYLQHYRSKRNANRIRRESAKTMTVFDPAYYVRMKQFQYAKERSEFDVDAQDRSLKLSNCYEESNALQCPKYPIYSTARKYGVPSLDWLFDKTNKHQREPTPLQNLNQAPSVHGSRPSKQIRTRHKKSKARKKCHKG